MPHRQTAAHHWMDEIPTWQGDFIATYGLPQHPPTRRGSRATYVTISPQVRSTLAHANIILRTVSDYVLRAMHAGHAPNATEAETPAPVSVYALAQRDRRPTQSISRGSRPSRRRRCIYHSRQISGLHRHDSAAPARRLFAARFPPRTSDRL
jgi:hypothetical protein